MRGDNSTLRTRPGRITRSYRSTCPSSVPAPVGKSGSLCICRHRSVTYRFLYRKARQGEGQRAEERAVRPPGFLEAEADLPFRLLSPSTTIIPVLNHVFACHCRQGFSAGHPYSGMAGWPQRHGLLYRFVSSIPLSSARFRLPACTHLSHHPRLTLSLSPFSN